jgi:hypothetical protein
MSQSGSGCGNGMPVRALSEAESRSRGRPSLEGGGDSPEGASSPRARRSLARGGVQPSSEAESHPRGRPALERGGVSLVRCCVHGAKRSFARGGWGCLFWWAAEAARVVGPCHWAVIVLGAFYCFCEFVFFCYLRKKMGFPGYLGDPYGRPRHS